MIGYFPNVEATERAFADGWFHTCDLAVVDADGYARVSDRSKNVIISGGENISSIEVEDVLHQYPAVSLAAVVAMTGERWGEVPCAFIELRAGQAADADELRDFCRGCLASYKVPRSFVFEPVRKTSTGKVQKAALRDRMRSMR